MKSIHLWLYREVILLSYEKNTQLMNALRTHKVHFRKASLQLYKVTTVFFLIVQTDTHRVRIYSVVIGIEIVVVCECLIRVTQNSSF